MSLNVNQFKSQLSGGGARPNLFRVILNFPVYVNGPTEKASFLCKAASIPASELGEITVDFRGRQVKLPGDRTFPDWQVTIINDNDFDVHDAFIRWHDGINGFASNKGFINPDTYTVDLKVQQLDKSCTTIKEFRFECAYPKLIGAIDLGYETRDAIEEFTVDFAYTQWTPSNSDLNIVDRVRGIANRGQRAIEGVSGLFG